MIWSLKQVGGRVSAACVAHLERRLQFALARFSGHIQRVQVVLEDQNGPRGGLDKHCRVVVRLREAGDVVAEVTSFLLDRAAVAESAGVDPAAIALDPGLGFGKSVEQNYALIARLGEIATLGRPLLVGASRKSFIGAVAGVAEPAERVPGSVVAAVVGWSAGARLIRTHDVAATRQGLEVARAVLGATPIA